MTDTTTYKNIAFSSLDSLYKELYIDVRDASFDSCVVGAGFEYFDNYTIVYC
jgi:hypothetical protein